MRMHAASGTQHDSVMAAKTNKATSGREHTQADGAFNATLRKMLSTAPKPHDEMKKGASRKASPRTSVKGPKG